MNGGVIELGPTQLGIATLLVVAAGGVSVLLRLQVERRLAVAAVRSVIQLGLIGFVLEEIFALSRPSLVVALVLAMTVFAGREAATRSSRSYPWIFFDAWLAMTVSCLVVGGVVTQLIVGVRPWFDPQYVIPLLGMILGNSLTGISLCLDRLLEHFASRADEVELRLAFGATREEAVREPVNSAVRTGLIPIINSMAAAGLVSLPGMMTGQILAGSAPLQAVAYQIVVMFMIAAAAATGSMIVALIAVRRLVGIDGVLKLSSISNQ
ncbi:MAG: iron export ABC transporter permease subunit FetB [bacterium]|nr:iron export ABC transporter permease subunit FetB [bacterium]